MNYFENRIDTMFRPGASAVLAYSDMRFDNYIQNKYIKVKRKRKYTGDKFPITDAIIDEVFAPYIAEYQAKIAEIDEELGYGEEEE